MYLCLLALNSCKVNLVQNIFYIEKRAKHTNIFVIWCKNILLSVKKNLKNNKYVLVSPILASLLVRMRKASQYLKEQRFGKTSVFKSVSRLWFTRDIAEAEM